MICYIRFPIHPMSLSNSPNFGSSPSAERPIGFDSPDLADKHMPEMLRGIVRGRVRGLLAPATPDSSRPTPPLTFAMGEVIGTFGQPIEGSPFQTYITPSGVKRVPPVPTARGGFFAAPAGFADATLPSQSSDTPEQQISQPALPARPKLDPTTWRLLEAQLEADITRLRQTGLPEHIIEEATAELRHAFRTGTYIPGSHPLLDGNVG
jgi:hypothetical protein